MPELGCVSNERRWSVRCCGDITGLSFWGAAAASGSADDCADAGGRGAGGRADAAAVVAAVVTLAIASLPQLIHPGVDPCDCALMAGACIGGGAGGGGGTTAAACAAGEGAP